MSDEDADALATYWQAAQPSAGGVQIDEEWTDEDDEGDSLEEDEEEREEHACEEAGNQGDDNPDEALVQRAIELMRGMEWISASRFAREFRIGSTRAGRIMDILVARGLVSAAADGPRNTRRVLLNNEQPDPEQESEEISLSS